MEKEAELGWRTWRISMARLGAYETDFRERLGREVTSLKAETARTETLCRATGLRVRYKTLGPDFWDLILA